LALARLGDPIGKSTLMDMLERSFWTSAERYEVRESNGSVRRYAMPPARIDQYLIASIDAAARLQDAELWAMIEHLQADASLAVQAAASQAVKKRRDAEKEGALPEFVRDALAHAAVKREER
jgi:hypothetical protein